MPKMTKGDAAPSITQQMNELSELVEQLENPEIELEAALLLYEKGVQLSGNIQKTLESAEQRIAQVSPDDSLLEGRDPAEVFTGEGHAPAPLSSQEAASGRVPQDAEALDVPDWLAEDLRAALDEGFEPVCRAMQSRAEVFLRVNALKASRDAARTALAGEGIEHEGRRRAVDAPQVGLRRGQSRGGVGVVQDGSAGVGGERDHEAFGHVER